MKNDCVCCTLSEDLIASVVGFCRTDPPDAFVIEASGVSDPRSLDQSILALQSSGHVRLNNRIYVLAADRFGSLDYADTELLIDHAAACDVVLVNKSDLVEDLQLNELETVLQRSTKDTEMRRTVSCDVPVETILDGQKTPYASTAKPVRSDRERHEDQYHGWSKTIGGPVGREAFRRFLHEVSGMALRAKGHVIFDDDPH